jgi:hypothetical protein
MLMSACVNGAASEEDAMTFSVSIHLRLCSSSINRFSPSLSSSFYEAFTLDMYLSSSMNHCSIARIGKLNPR